MYFYDHKLTKDTMLVNINCINQMYLYVHMYKQSV